MKKSNWKALFLTAGMLTAIVLPWVCLEAKEEPVLAGPVVEALPPIEAKPITMEAESPKPDVTTEAPEIPETPAIVPRYALISLTEDERRTLAAVVYLEAGNQSAEGQQAVAEVVFNRMVSPDFPGTLTDVIDQPGQFSTASRARSIDPPQAAYDAIDAALYGGNSVLPLEVVFFSRAGENDRVWGTIEDHIFCYGYN